MAKRTTAPRALRMNPVGMQAERDVMKPAKPKDNPMMIAVIAAKKGGKKK